MKKKGLALALVFCMVASLFGSRKLTTKADDFDPAQIPTQLVLWEGNWNTPYKNIDPGFAEWFELGDTTLSEYYTFIYQFTYAPGSLFYPGQSISGMFGQFLGTEASYSGLNKNQALYSYADLSSKNLTADTAPLCAVVYNVPEEDWEGFINSPWRWMYSDRGICVAVDGKVPQLPDGYDAWQLISYAPVFDPFNFGVTTYFAPVKFAPGPGYTLEKSDSCIKWYTPDGKLAWDIEETEEVITADLTDQYCVPEALVKDWNAKDKEIKVSYNYKGYTVIADIPAGKVADVETEWYGPEYFAFLNAEYITVKDWFNREVAIDVLFN